MLRPEGSERSARVAIEPASIRADPEVPIAIILYGFHATVRQPAGRGQGHDLPVAHPAQAAVRSDPEIALTVLSDGKDDVVGQSITGCERRHGAVVETFQATSVRSIPECPVAGDVGRQHPTRR